MGLDRRTFVGVMGGFPLWLMSPSAGRGADERGSFQEITSLQERAIKKGLKALDRMQSSSGAIGSNHPVAFTALGGLAFLASGSTPDRGPYAKNIRRAVRFLLRATHRSGYICEGARFQGGSGMHGHGYATLFLAELYGTFGGGLESGDRDIRDALGRAIRVIEQSQDSNGGWSYEPKPMGHEGSVTITQVQALRAARNGGLRVEKKVIEKGIDYIRKSTGADGTVAYSLGMHMSGGGSYALTAAGMCVFHYLGLHDDPKLRLGMKRLDAFLAEKQRGGHDYYGHFYAGQAVWFERRIDRKYWERNYERLRSDILQRQDVSTGTWSGSYGGAFATSCALMVLQIPCRLLSIFES